MANNGLVSLFFLSELLDILFDKRFFLHLSLSLYFCFLPYLSLLPSLFICRLPWDSQIRGCLYEMRPFYMCGHQKSSLPDSLLSRLGTQHAFPRYADGHVDGSVNIPHTQMLGRWVDFSCATTCSG